jgi:pantoate--beta-alanine ligase
MQVFDTIGAMRAALAGRRRIVCVPTMGNLHEGHLDLMRIARAAGDTVVATIFVNRLQFAPHEDFDRYPRTVARDHELLIGAGVNYLFAPTEQELYPEPQTVRVEPSPALANILEGAHRPGFFGGVATVVLKLFNILTPQAAVFGKKDYQQVAVIQNMVRQLALPIQIIAAPTRRADDGLALSSRDGYLNAAERAEAPRLQRTLVTMANSISKGERDFNKLEQQSLTHLKSNGWQPDYVTVRRQSDLAAPSPQDHALVIVTAARLGTTRLIDNLEISI